MVRAMRALRLALTCALLGVTGLACAPVQSKTHFQRWDEYHAKLDAEEAAAAAAEGSEAAPASTPAKAKTAPTAASASTSTPPITTTATASRVVRPQETTPPADEDVIY